jgi:hypothetical protein
VSRKLPQGHRPVKLDAGERGDERRTQIIAGLATMLAIHFGFGVVIVVAVLLYALAAAVFP